MQRKDFLKVTGALGLSGLLPLKSVIAASQNVAQIDCVKAPDETAGPYPFDLSGNSAMFHDNITEGNSGLPFTLNLTVVNVDNNCVVVPNARIDIWHCNKDGYYSEFANQPGYLGTQSHLNETFFRGIQMTDANGQAQFTTIYPGWYTGRLTHIHFEVFINGVSKKISQMAFDDSVTNNVYTNNSLYSTHGVNTSVTFATDNVFSDTANTQNEYLNLIGDAVNGYSGTYVIGLNLGTTGIDDFAETKGQFSLQQNTPNPLTVKTSFEFSLLYDSDVELNVFDMMGRKVAEIIKTKMPQGNHAVEFNRAVAGQTLVAGNYLYQLSVSNTNGVFRQAKVLTIQ